MSDNQPTRKPTLCNLYQQYLDSQDSAGFISKVSHSYTPATLQRLAEHSQREIRRAAVLALGFLGDYEVNHTLGRALHDEDRTVRIVAENGIRNVWTRAGSESDRKSLGIIVRLNSAKQFKEAVVRATELIEKIAWFADAWNHLGDARRRRHDDFGKVSEHDHDSKKFVDCGDGPGGGLGLDVGRRARAARPGTTRRSRR